MYIAIAIVRDNDRKIQRETGIDLERTFVVATSTIDELDDYLSINQQEKRNIQSVPGVLHVAANNPVPLSGNNWCTGYATSPEPNPKNRVSVCLHMGDEDMHNVYDFKIIEGRFFNDDEFVRTNRQENKQVGVVMISELVASRLFPDGNAVGQTIYSQGEPLIVQEVVGIYDRLIGGSTNLDEPFANVIVPRVEKGSYQPYAVRVAPGYALTQVMEDVVQRLKEMPNRFVQENSTESMKDYKDTQYRTQTSINAILKVIIATLAFINVLGVVSLAWFNVNKRRKQVGTRRALGARKSNIVAYFMLENWIITSIGIALGVVLAISLNYVMDSNFQTGKIQLSSLLAGSVLLWALGLIAVFLPAVRAASISPATATRSI